jgi:hypothetical protein
MITFIRFVLLCLMGSSASLTQKTKQWLGALWCVVICLLVNPAHAQITSTLTLDQSVQGVAEFKLKRFVGDLELRLPLPEGSWTVRAIVPVKSTHTPPIEGLGVLLDRVVNQQLEASVWVAVYPQDNKNWNPGNSCFGSLLSRERGTNLSGYCHSLKDSPHMTNSSSEWQVKVRKSWDESGTRWPKQALFLSHTNEVRGRFAVSVSYGIAFSAMGLPIDADSSIDIRKKLEGWWTNNRQTESVRSAIAWYEAYSARVYEAVEGARPTAILVADSPVPKLKLVVKDMSAAFPDLALAAPPSAARPEPQAQASAQLSSDAERDRLAADLEVSRKKQQELEEQLRVAQAAPAPNIRPTLGVQTERRVALVIGNAQYKSSPLENSVNDATDIDQALKRFGFQTTFLRNASLSQMRESTRRFADQLSNADVALIYFAGHGIESRNKNYMIPVNSDLKFEYELADQAYDAGAWLEMLEMIKSNNAERVNIVILDACRNNNLIGSRSLNRGLGRMDAPAGTFLSYSTAPGKVAADGGKGERNSPFTRNLLKAIQQPGQPIEEVFKEVRRNVTRETNGAQVPWESTSLTGFFSFRQTR